MEVEERNLTKVKLYALGHTLLCVWASVLYFEMWPEDSDFSGETTSILIGVAALFHAVTSYYIVKLLKLDIYFLDSKKSFKIATLAILTFFGIFCSFFAISNVHSYWLRYMFPGESSAPSEYYQFVAIVAVATTLYCWYFLVSVINLLFVLVKNALESAREKIPIMQNFGHRIVCNEVLFLRPLKEAINSH